MATPSASARRGKALTVRLACIDAPETAQGPYGQQARAYLQQRLPIGREVSLEVKTTDRYGRTVAEVISGININLALVEAGLAFAYRQYLGGCDAKAYLEAEERASSRPPMASGRSQAASPAPGISAADAALQPSPMAPPQAGAGTAARRSAPMPKPRSCWLRGTATSMAMAMEKPVNRCAKSNQKYPPPRGVLCLQNVVPMRCWH